MTDLIGEHRTTGATAVGPAVHIGLEEEAVHDELAATVEHIVQAGRATRPVEQVVLVDGHPRHPPAVGGPRVAGAGELLLFDKQLLAGGVPLLRCDDWRQVHRGISFESGRYVETRHGGKTS